MSQKQIEPERHEIGAYEALTGNKAAREAAAKVKAQIEALDVDKDALMRAERNDVLDAVIDRLGENGENWTNGYIMLPKPGYRELPWETGSVAAMATSAARFREAGESFCVMGGFGCQEGIHSHDAINEAVDAVARAVYPAALNRGSYGYRSGKIYNWNDAQINGRAVVEGLRLAKSQPLTRTYNDPSAKG